MSAKPAGFGPSTVVVRRARRTRIINASLGLAASIMTLLIARAAFATAVLPGPSHSTNIALTYDNMRLVVANPNANTVSVFAVLDAQHHDLRQKLAEIPVGIEPRCVAITPDNQKVFVTNAVDGTVSAVSLVNFKVLATIPVGTEPRGCALTPSGNVLYVANHTSADVSVIDATKFTVIATIHLGGNPYAVAITDIGHGNDFAETILITDFFANLIPGGKGEGFDTGKQGRVFAFPFGKGAGFLTIIPLSPLSNVGFTADRTDFCPQSSPNPAKLHSTIFCPSTSAPPGSPVITMNPQGCFPNQLYSGVIRPVPGTTLPDQLRLTTICAEPEPPVQFTTNVQAVIKSVDTMTDKQVVSEDDNLNAQIKTEPVPANPGTSLQHLFGGDIAAIDATLDGKVFLIVSRNNDYVLKATVDPATHRLVIGAPNNVIRFQTGHIPTGIVISTDGTRAYTNNEVSSSVSVLDVQFPSITFADIPSTATPAPGTTEQVVRVGKLAFFTGLGIPSDTSIFSTSVQNIPTLANCILVSKPKLARVCRASSGGWSSCASCHPEGLSDHVTWIFAAGPRRTIPLDGSIDKDNPFNSRVLLWSASRDSNVDFNQNSIGVQGGTGWTGALGSPPPSDIYDHGITEGVPPLDALTTWVQVGARALIQPAPSNTAVFTAGQSLFGSNIPGTSKSCATCHGGPKWTKSEIMYIDNPAFTSNPNVMPPATAGTPIDSGIFAAGAQIVTLTRNNNTFEKTFKYLEDVGTFNPADPLEIRGQGAAAGQTALGVLGFNVPSLLGIAFHAPFLHNGAAQNLAAVFAVHKLPNNMTIKQTFSAAQQVDLQVFLNAIDSRTPTFPSEAEQFKNGE